MTEEETEPSSPAAPEGATGLVLNEGSARMPLQSREPVGNCLPALSTWR